MRKSKLLSVMFFLVLVSERIDTAPVYVNDMWTPASLFDWFTERLPALRISLFEVVCILLLLVTRKQPVARPVVRAIQVSAATVLFMVAYGQATGGVLQPIYMLTRAWFSGLIIGLLAMKVLATAEDFDRIADVVVIATIWRALIVVLYYLKARNYPWDRFPLTMTTHEDSALFAVGLTILVSRAVELRSKKAVRYLVLSLPLIFAAMKYNNRRLVWSSLVTSLLVVYFILPTSSAVGRRINRTIRLLAPALILYVAIGWGRPEAIFKPVRTFSTMASAKQADGSVDGSTKARDNENEGMLTQMQGQPILGTGFGHEWLLLDSSGAVPLDIFPLYHFSPHCSELVLFVFIGGLGVAGMWGVIAVAVYLLARTYRKSRDPTERTIAIMGISAIIAYLNQAFGDMGLIHPMPSMLMGFAFAAAARLSISSGAWSSGATRRRLSSAQNA